MLKDRPHHAAPREGWARACHAVVVIKRGRKHAREEARGQQDREHVRRQYVAREAGDDTGRQGERRRRKNISSGPARL